MGDQKDILDVATFADFVGMSPVLARSRIDSQGLACEVRDGEPFVSREDAEAFRLRHAEQSAMLQELYDIGMEAEDDEPAPIAP